MNQQKILKRKNPDLIKEILYSKDEKFSLYNFHLLVIYFSEKSRQLNSRVMKLNTTAYTEWKNDHKTSESTVFKHCQKAQMTIIKLLLMNELILVINIDLQFHSYMFYSNYEKITCILCNTIQFTKFYRQICITCIP